MSVRRCLVLDTVVNDKEHIGYRVQFEDGETVDVYKKPFINMLIARRILVLNYTYHNDILFYRGIKLGDVTLDFTELMYPFLVYDNIVKIYKNQSLCNINSAEKLFGEGYEIKTSTQFGKVSTFTNLQLLYHDEIIKTIFHKSCKQSRGSSYKFTLYHFTGFMFDKGRLCLCIYTDSGSVDKQTKLTVMNNRNSEEQFMLEPIKFYERDIRQ